MIGMNVFRMGCNEIITQVYFEIPALRRTSAYIMLTFVQPNIYLSVLNDLFNFVQNSQTIDEALTKSIEPHANHVKYYAILLCS